MVELKPKWWTAAICCGSREKERERERWTRGKGDARDGETVVIYTLPLAANWKQEEMDTEPGVDTHNAQSGHLHEVKLSEVRSSTGA